MTDARAGHLDLDALADVLAGERTSDPHLRSCAACAQRLADLAAAEVAVVASLATLPVPAVPDGLAERLAAALREEAERAAPERTSQGSTRVAPLRRRPPAWSGAVAASLVLVVAGAVGFSVLRGPGAGTDSAPSAAGGGTAESGGAAAELAEAGPVRSSTGTDWAEQGARAAAVPRVLAGTAVPGAGAGGVEGTAGPGADARRDPLARLRDPAALVECLTAVTGPATPAPETLAVDYAAFAGSPALAVLQRDGPPDTLLLTVVGPGCTAADPEQLLRTRVPAP